MGTVKNVELSMQSVRRLLERIGFTEGEKKIGRQSIVFGCVDYNVYDEDFAMGTCFRQTMCTDMAFFAFHFHDLFPDFYPTDEYNDWSE